MGRSEVTLTQSEIPVLVEDCETGEMIPNPDYPSDLRCKSGHVAPTGTRFFAISGKALPDAFAGVYCEHCLSIANRISNAQKQGLAPEINPEEELDKLMAAAEETDG